MAQQTYKLAELKPGPVYSQVGAPGGRFMVITARHNTLKRGGLPPRLVLVHLNPREPDGALTHYCYGLFIDEMSHDTPDFIKVAENLQEGSAEIWPEQDDSHRG